jgi:hypothetical protein
MQPSNYIRILIRHLQYLVIIGSLRVPWPAALSVVFQALSWLFAATSSQVVSLDCLIKQEVGDATTASSVVTRVPVAVLVALVYLIAPVGFLILVLLTRGAVWACFASKLKLFPSPPAAAAAAPPPAGAAVEEQVSISSNESHCSTGSARNGPTAGMREVVYVSCLVVLFFFYPSLVRVGLSFFACYHLDQIGPQDPYAAYAVANATHGYWVSDMDQPCFEGWHLSWALALGLPCTLLFCLGVPLGILCLLYPNRHRLNSPSVKGALGFLYLNYRSRRYYWEAISNAEIAVLVCISVFGFTLGMYYSTLLLNATFTMFFMLQYFMKPHSSESLHVTQLASWSCLYLTTMFGLTLLPFDVEAPSVYGSAIGVLGLIMNIAFVLWASYKAAAMSRGVAAKMVAAVRPWVIRLRVCCWYGCRGLRQAAR